MAGLLSGVYELQYDDMHVYKFKLHPIDHKLRNGCIFSMLELL